MRYHRSQAAVTIEGVRRPSKCQYKMRRVAGQQGTRVEVPQGETAHLSGGGPHDDGVEAQAVMLWGERRGDGDDQATGS